MIPVDVGLYSVRASEDGGPGVGKKYSAEMCSKLARMVTILRQMLRCLKSSYKLRDSRWESVSANPTRVYHLSAGKGSEVETRFL